MIIVICSSIFYSDCKICCVHTIPTSDCDYNAVIVNVCFNHPYLHGASLQPTTQ